MQRFTAKAVAPSRVVAPTACHRAFSTTRAVLTAAGATPPPPPPPPPTAPTSPPVARAAPTAPPPPPPPPPPVSAPAKASRVPAPAATPPPPPSPPLPVLPVPPAQRTDRPARPPSPPPRATSSAPPRANRKPRNDSSKTKNAPVKTKATPAQAKAKAKTTSAPRAQPRHSAAAPAPLPPPPRRPPSAPAAPPSAPRAPLAPLAPQPPVTARVIYDIAPPKQGAEGAALEAGAEARPPLPASFAATVEAAVRHARDTIPARRTPRSPDVVPEPEAPVAMNETVDAELVAPPSSAPRPVVHEAEVVSESLKASEPTLEAEASDEATLAPLPTTFASSVEKHEIPAQMGGDEDADDDSPRAVSTDPSTAALGAVEEVNPFVVWSGVRDPAAATTVGTAGTDRPASYVRLTLPPPRTPRAVAVLQLVERPPTVTALLDAVARALDEVEAWAARSAPRAPEPSTSSSATAADRDAGKRTVRLTSSAHLPFFTAAQHPLELSESELMAYCAQRDQLLQRLHHPTVPGLAFEAEANGAVSDLAAELFFACATRVVAAPTAESSVGFPSLPLGLFPSFHTVNRLRQLQGVLFTVENVPKLHEYDAASFAEAGLAEHRAPREKDGGHDGSGRRTEEATVSAQMAARPPAPGWGAWLEDQALCRLCRSTSARELVVTRLLLPRDFTCQRRGLEGLFSVMPAWRAYALLTAVHGAEDATTAAAQCRGVVARLLVGDGGAHHTAAVAPTPPLRSAARCHSRRLLRHAAATQRRQLAPLASPLFVSFRRSEVAQWAPKARALAEAMAPAASHPGGRDGATAVLDVSAQALADTLPLLDAFKDKGLHRSQNLRLILLGDADAGARAVLEEASCAAVISTVSPFTVTPFSTSVQQVRLFAHHGWPADLQHDTLAAAATYLQHLRTPYVLCATPALQRLVVAYLSEALGMLTIKTASGAAAVPEAQLERAAVTALGLFCSPTALLSVYGGPAGVQAMLASLRACAVAPREQAGLAAAADAGDAALRGLQAFSSAAQPGSFATTFSRHDSARPASAAAKSAHGGSEPAPSSLSDAEVAQRLLAVVVNCLCELLQEDALLSVNDANLLSVSALGFSENTGGALALADYMGLDALAEEMRQLAARHGSALAPHPLLEQMVREKHTFASIAAESDAN